MLMKGLKKILIENVALLDSVAQKLLEVETITGGEEFNNILEEYREVEK